MFRALLILGFGPFNKYPVEKKKWWLTHYKLNHYTSILKLVAVGRIVYYNIVSMFHNYSWHIIAGEAFRNRLRGHFQVNM